MSLTKLYIKEHYPLALAITLLIAILSGMLFVISDSIDTEDSILKGEISNCSKKNTFTNTGAGKGVIVVCEVNLESGETISIPLNGQNKYPETYPVSVLIERKQGKKIGNKNFILIGLQ